jgi:hypothetical protein
VEPGVLQCMAAALVPGQALVRRAWEREPRCVRTLQRACVSGHCSIREQGRGWAAGGHYGVAVCAQVSIALCVRSEWMPMVALHASPCVGVRCKPTEGGGPGLTTLSVALAPPVRATCVEPMYRPRCCCWCCCYCR